MKLRNILYVLLLVGIPSAWAEAPAYPLDTINGQVVYCYTVEKSIGLYRISVNFGCKQEQILQLNPKLKEQGLHYGETIYVPVSEEQLQQWAAEAKAAEEKAAEVVPVVEKTEVVVADSVARDSIMTEVEEPMVTLADDPDCLRLTLLLPLYADKVDRTQQMERFWDFYEGALLAIYDVQSTGQKLDVTVIDTEKSDAMVRQLMNEGKLDGTQAIIGPAYASMVDIIEPWAREKQIPVFIPFSSSVKGIATNPYLYQFNATDEQQAAKLTAYCKGIENVHCILVEARESDIPTSIRLFRQKIVAEGISADTTTIQQILADSLFTAMKEGAENILILNTEKFSNTSMIMPSIVRSAEHGSLTLMSQYSWHKEDIGLPQLYTSVFDTDVPADPTHYNELYEQYFHHTHASSAPRYDLLGYDLTRMVIAHLLGQEYMGLQSDILFERVSEQGGYINKNVQVIHR